MRRSFGERALQVHPPLLSACETERAPASQPASARAANSTPPTFVGAGTDRGVCVSGTGQRRPCPHTQRPERGTASKACVPPGAKNNPKKPLKGPDTASSGSFRVSRQAGRPRQNELRGSEPLSHPHTISLKACPPHQAERGPQGGSSGSAQPPPPPGLKGPQGSSPPQGPGLGLKGPQG